MVPNSLLSEALRGITVLDLSRNLAGPVLHHAAW